MEDINNKLNSGEVANLFNKEELDTIDADLRNIATGNQLANLYSFFISRVRENLHIVLCM